MAVLVTGGAGYIGSHICVELLCNQLDVVIVDNFVNSSSEVISRIQELANRRVKFYEVDITDESKLTAVFEENNIDVVMHLAGYKSVSESIANPIDYYRNNIVGTLVLCKVMSFFNVKKMVFSSSATVYSSIEESPLVETCDLATANPYGRTKLMSEQLLSDICDSDQEWLITVLRYFNPIGAHSSGRIGEDPNGIPNNLLPYISQVAIGKISELKVYGNNYETRDGTGIRDYIHVVDLAKGHIKALYNLEKYKGITVYNLGTGIGYSVLEVVDAFEKAARKKIPYTIVERRPGDVAVSYANPAKAREELGWTATKGILEMCEDAWRWQINNPNGYK